MQKLTSWLARVAIAGCATSGLVVACRHEAPARPVAPIPTEAKPIAPRPEPLPPGVKTGDSSRSCSDSGLCFDGPSSLDQMRALGATPAAAPIDAAIDSGASLPPVPDAPVLRDSGMPLSQ